MPMIITDNELKDIREGKIKVEDLYKAHETKVNGNDKYLIKMLESQISLFGQINKLNIDIMRALKIKLVTNLALFFIIIGMLVYQILGV